MTVCNSLQFGNSGKCPQIERTHIRELNARSVSTVILLTVLVSVGLTACAPGGRQPVLTPPAADLPPSPLGEKMVRCIQDEGWEAELTWDGGVVGPEMPTDQTSIWREVADACQKETGYGDLAQLTDTQIRELYGQEVAEYECLVEQAKSPAEPPSEQGYIDTFRTADQYYAIKDVQATPELMRLCPAPTWFLNLTGLK